MYQTQLNNVDRKIDQAQRLYENGNKDAAFRMQNEVLKSMMDFINELASRRR